MKFEKLKELIPTLEVKETPLGRGWYLKSPDDDKLTIYLRRDTKVVKVPWFGKPQFKEEYRAAIHWDGVYLNVLNEDESLELGEYISIHAGKKSKEDDDKRQKEFNERYGN